MFPPYFFLIKMTATPTPRPAAPRPTSTSTHQGIVFSGCSVCVVGSVVGMVAFCDSEVDSLACVSAVDSVVL